MASRTSAGNLGSGGGAKESGNGKENGGPRDSVFDLDSEAFASDQFRMHEFKVTTPQTPTLSLMRRGGCR